jgi:acylphosphatase
LANGGGSAGTRAHVIVRGRVQNVFFRAACREQATRLGVSGFVSNLRDGRVEGVFEGEAAAVRAVVEWCRHGPPGAAVASIEVTYEEPVGEVGFRVR